MFAIRAESSKYPLEVAIIEPKLQLPIARAVKGSAHLLLIRGAISIEIKQAIGIALKRNKSSQIP
jgi:hypothetical protein